MAETKKGAPMTTSVVVRRKGVVRILPSHVTILKSCEGRSIWNECGCKKSVLIQDVDSVEVVVV